MLRGNHGQGGRKNQIWLSRVEGRLPRDCHATRVITEEDTMQFKYVTLDIDGSVGVLKLDHQEVMNALSMDMLGGLVDALDVIDERRSDVRCMV